MKTNAGSLNVHETPFAESICVQRGALVDASIELALEYQCSRFYIECSYEDAAESWSDARIAHYRARIAELCLRPIVHGNYRLPLCHDVSDVRAGAVIAVRREIDLASAFAAPLIVHGSAIFTHRNAKLSRQGGLDAFCESVQELADYAAPLGVQLWLENLEFYKDRHPFYTIFSCEEDYATVLGRIQRDNVRFILDVGHENVGSGNPTAVFERFHERIAALDLNDNHGVQDTHLGLGRGNVDFLGLLGAVHEFGWRGHVTLETRSALVVDDVAFLRRTYVEACRTRTRTPESLQS
jgi:sugar phosphate isomerase/epimerase